MTRYIIFKPLLLNKLGLQRVDKTDSLYDAACQTLHYLANYHRIDSKHVSVSHVWPDAMHHISHKIGRVWYFVSQKFLMLNYHTLIEPSYAC